MISTQLKKCLVVSASTLSISALSALGLMVLIPHEAIAQTGGETQTGVEGSQVNPGSTEGTGQVVPPPDTAEDMPGMTGGGTRSPEMMTPGMESETDADMNADGIETDGVETDEMDADGMEADSMETDSNMTPSGTITVPNSNMPSNTVPTTTTTPSTPPRR